MCNGITFISKDPPHPTLTHNPPVRFLPWKENTEWIMAFYGIWLRIIVVILD